MTQLSETIAAEARGAGFTADALRLDAPAARARRSLHGIRDQVLRRLRRRGAVVGLSGGIDSSVTAALCVAALGPSNVFGDLHAGEGFRSATACASAGCVADSLGIEHVVEDIAPMLPAAGCYQRRDDSIRELVPEFGAGLGLQGGARQRAAGRAATTSPSWWCSRRTASAQKLRMPLDVYLGIVAATNMKQRTRKQIEYYHADRLNYAVARHAEPARIRPGLLRQERRRRRRRQADRASLQDARSTSSPSTSACRRKSAARPPTTDTWSLAQTQEEFYFALPYRADGSVPVRPEQRHPGGGRRARSRPDAGAGRARSGATSRPSARRPAICTSRRC